MSTTTIPDATELLKPDGPVCMVITATLKPVGGTDRFQPAGFPEVGHVIYDAPRFENGRASKEKVCIVDSCASMANHLESVCLEGAGSLQLHEDLTGLPYVVCVTDGDIKIADGEVKADSNQKNAIVSSFTEGHRLASDYFLDAKPDREKDETLRDVLRREFNIVEVQRDKTYFIPPATWWDIYKTIFKYDPNSLVHGVLFAKEQIKISRVLTGHMEAFGASRVGSSGVKFDRLQKTTSGQPIFAVDEETAEKIQATFVIDLGLLRSFGRGEDGLANNQKEVLLNLALWKIGRLLVQPFRYRSNCFLKCDELSVSMDGEPLIKLADTDGNNANDVEVKNRELIRLHSEEVRAWLANVDVASTLRSCSFQETDAAKDVYYPAGALFKAGEEQS